MILLLKYSHVAHTYFSLMWNMIWWTPFFAAMSSSRTDVVTQIVRVSVCPWPFHPFSVFGVMNLKFHKKSKIVKRIWLESSGVSRCFKGCSRVFTVCHSSGKYPNDKSLRLFHTFQDVSSVNRLTTTDCKAVAHANYSSFFKFTVF